jgi:hypothetical protein
MSLHQLSRILLLCLIVSFVISCKKDPGEGGNSVIKGKVIRRNYTVFPIRFAESPGKDEDVYIIYGEGSNAFDDRTKASYDGTFKFETLKKGKYRIYVYTDDTVATNYGNTTEVIVETEITKNRSEKEIPTITIINL